MSMVLHILVDHQNVVGRRLVLNYIRTPHTHYYLESSGRAAYKETHRNPNVIKVATESPCITQPP